MRPSARRARSGAADAGRFVAETRFAGAVVTSFWPRGSVERLLPPGARLGRVAGARSPRRHPVLFLFGHHDRSAVFFASLPLSTGVTFPEFLVAVPFVECGDTTPHLFVGPVFSGEAVVTWSGNVHYGFLKRMVPMEWIGDSFVVSDERGALLLHARADPAGPWERATGSRLPALASVAGSAALPVLGRRADGAWVTSSFAWGFADASVRPVRAVVTIDAPLGRGLEPRVCHARPADSLEVRGMRWRLSWPERRS